MQEAISDAKYALLKNEKYSGYTVVHDYFLSCSLLLPGNKLRREGDRNFSRTVDQ